MAIDPQHPVTTPYDNKISRLKQKIGRKSGPNHQLRDKLTHLKVKQYGKIQSTPTPVPWSATSQTMLDTANRDYNTTTAGITNQQQAMEQQYGINDTSNPFSRAAMLQQAYQRSQNTTDNSYAAQGQLYSGSLSNARGYNTQNMNEGTDALLRAYQAQKQQFGQAGLQAKTAQADATAAAQVQALQDALNTRPEGTPGTPKFVKRYYKQKIQKAEKHHRGHRADKLRSKLRNLGNPNPMTPPHLPPTP